MWWKRTINIDLYFLILLNKNTKWNEKYKIKEIFIKNNKIKNLKKNNEKIYLIFVPKILSHEIFSFKIKQIAEFGIFWETFK